MVVSVHYELMFGDLWWVGVLVFIVVVLKVLVSFKGKSKSRGDVNSVVQVEHRENEYLATKNEQRLYKLLRTVLPQDYSIHCQVSLMALVKPVDYRDNSKTWAKRVDFVITDHDTKVLAVIEFDDASHQTAKAKRSDEYKDMALKGRHPLIRIASTKVLNEAEIASRLKAETDLNF